MSLDAQQRRKYKKFAEESKAAVAVSHDQDGTPGVLSAITIVSPGVTRVSHGPSHLAVTVFCPTPNHPAVSDVSDCERCLDGLSTAPAWLKERAALREGNADA